MTWHKTIRLRMPIEDRDAIMRVCELFKWNFTEVLRLLSSLRELSTFVLSYGQIAESLRLIMRPKLGFILHDVADLAARVDKVVDQQNKATLATSVIASDRAPMFIPDDQDTSDDREPRLVDSSGDHDFRFFGRLQSDLKTLGYHVGKKSSLTQRRESLARGIKQLGIHAVVDHLDFLIKLHRNAPLRQDAVYLWKQDREWICQK